jgi:hypothetical protein
MTVLHLATAQSLSDVLEVFADDITLPSTHTVQADVRLNLTSSVVSVLYTLVTRYNSNLSYSHTYYTDLNTLFDMTINLFTHFSRIDFQRLSLRGR